MQKNSNSKIPRKAPLLDPVERLSEISVGLIIALTCTGTLSVLDADTNDVQNMLISALGCNFAWGIIDGVMYLSNAFAQHGRENLMINSLDHLDSETARDLIAQSMPAAIAGTQTPEDLEKIRVSLVKMAAKQQRMPKLNTTDIQSACLIMLLVFGATLPIVIPFICTDNTSLALRISNVIAILSMFYCGWLLAGYCGYNKWKTSITLTIIGIVLVTVTIALGG